jgi:hypothetical protein
MGSYVAGSIGPAYVPDQKALQKLEAYPETIHVDDLGEFGFHPDVIDGLRRHQLLVSNAQVRAWIERGIPGGCAGAFLDQPSGGLAGNPGPLGPCCATCTGVGCPRCDKSRGLHCPHAVGEPGPSGSNGHHAMPWYVSHIMRQQRRQNRVN